MTKHLVLAVLIVGSVFAGRSTAWESPYFQPPSGPRTTWRGRIHIRNSPHRSVYRERWGGGLTPTAGAVMTNLFTNATSLGLAYLGGPGVVTDEGRSGTEEFRVQESAAIRSELLDMRKQARDRDLLLRQLETKEDALREKTGLEKRIRQRPDEAPDGDVSNDNDTVRFEL
jgi:hypothetical protein